MSRHKRVFRSQGVKRQIWSWRLCEQVAQYHHIYNFNDHSLCSGLFTVLVPNPFGWVRRDIYPVGNPGYDSSLSRTGKWFRSKWQSWKPETRPGTGRLEVWEPLASLFRRLGIIDIPSIRETLELAFWGNEGFRSGAERNGENGSFSKWRKQ